MTENALHLYRTPERNTIYTKNSEVNQINLAVLYFRTAQKSADIGSNRTRVPHRIYTRHDTVVGIYLFLSFQIHNLF